MNFSTADHLAQVEAALVRGGSLLAATARRLDCLAHVARELPRADRGRLRSASARLVDLLEALASIRGELDPLLAAAGEIHRQGEDAYEVASLSG